MPVTIYINGANDPNEKYQSPTFVAQTAYQRCYLSNDQPGVENPEFSSKRPM
jgi:hypothetical protein